MASGRTGCGRPKCGSPTAAIHGGVELIESADVESGEIVVQAVRGRSVLRLGWSYVASALKLKIAAPGGARIPRAKLNGSTRPLMQVSIDGEIGAATPLEVSVAARRRDDRRARARTDRVTLA